MSTDYAHRADDQHARKLERAREMLASWTEEDWQHTFATHPTTDTYNEESAA